MFTKNVASTSMTVICCQLPVFMPFAHCYSMTPLSPATTCSGPTEHLTSSSDKKVLIFEQQLMYQIAFRALQVLVMSFQQLYFSASSDSFLVFFGPTISRCAS